MYKSISKALISWFQHNKRVLPWRENRSPYTIWLSEIILQQTRVNQGLPYFERFISAYPTVIDLANAPIDEVLKLWQGLGYYSRARNLHNTAQAVLENYKGVFPQTYKELMGLKGIGDYTASAISSIAGNEYQAVLDGNVYRVLSRVFKIDTPINNSQAKKVFKEYAFKLLDKDNPGEFNEAIMELGALICKPQNPMCSDCPIIQFCASQKEDSQSQYPIKQRKGAVKERSLVYLFIHNQNECIIKRREEKDIWQGLYEFRAIENINEYPLILETKHRLTHQLLFIQLYEQEIKGALPELLAGEIAIPIKDINLYAFPKPFVAFIERLNT